MKKIVALGNESVVLESNGFTPIAYKKEFGQDFFKDLFILARAFSNGSIEPENMTDDQIEAFDLMIFYKLFWIFAYSHNPNVENFEEFFRKHSDFDVMELLTEVIDLIQHSFKTKKK